MRWYMQKSQGDLLLALADTASYLCRDEAACRIAVAGRTCPAQLVTALVHGYDVRAWQQLREHQPRRLLVSTAFCLD